MADATAINNSSEQEKLKKKENRAFKIKAALFLGGVTFASALAGFSSTVATVRKKEHEILLASGMDPNKISEILNHEAGSRLALRALGWGTIYAVLGVSAICYAGWKLSGASNFDEFRLKMGRKLPKIPKSENPGRSEFDSLSDFLEYVSQDSKKGPTS